MGDVDRRHLKLAASRSMAQLHGSLANYFDILLLTKYG